MATAATNQRPRFKTAHLIPVSEDAAAPSRTQADAAAEAYEAALVRWQNENRPAGLDSNCCAACGEPLEGQHLTVLGDGAAICYGGPHGSKCFDRYQAQRRAEAEAALRIQVGGG